jgi:lipopolysaccharide/colanic/teichoic acid biosynthesis glycosyltransferase
VRIKRAFDVIVATASLVVSSPVWLVTAAAIKLTSAGAVLHRAPRAGLDGEPFTILKFRTMRIGHSGPGITFAGDPRVTRVGVVLRKLKVDELPQLVNVLRGDMSLVGPRPEDPRYVAHYTDEQRRVLTVRPGMTSPAAVAYRHEERMMDPTGGNVESTYLDRILPAKLALDLDYVDRRSFWLDLRVLANTIAAVFRPPPPSE